MVTFNQRKFFWSTNIMENIIPSSMTKVVACRMCLADNIKMISIRNSYFQVLYQKLADSQLITDDWRPDTVCYNCYSLMEKYSKLRDMTLRAESILMQLIENGIDFSQESVISLNEGIPLSNIMNEKCSENDFEFQDNSPINSELVEVDVKEEHLVKQEFTEYAEDIFEIKVEDNPAIKKRKLSHSNVKLKKGKEPKLVDYEQKKTNMSTKIGPTHTSIDGEKLFACDRCDKSFTQMGNLNRHKRLHTGGKPHICDICNKTFAERVYLKVHRRIHTGEKRFSCSSCDKTFVQKCNLQRHERIHTGEKPFSCSKCHKTFSDMSQLKCHMRFHTKEKPYACDRCGMRFSNVSNFNSHMRTHTGEKPYACNICFKTFPRSTTLKSHMLIHTGEKPYDCYKCNKKFNSSKYLKRHMRVHTGEKPYACDICDKTFTVKKSLKKHMSIHTGEKPL